MEEDLMPAVQIKVMEPDVEVTSPKGREEHNMPRRMYINRKDIDIHGPTPRCPGCHAIMMGKNPVSHNEECRETIQKKVAESESGQRREQEANH